MKRTLSILLVAAILLVTIPLSVSSGAAQVGKPVTGIIPFSYQTQPKGNVEGTMFYTDAWFNDSAFEYDHQLATASLQAAWAGFRSGRTGESLIRPFLIRIGCAENTLMIKDFGVTDNFGDVCAFAFGLKSLPGTDYYLLPVIIRGDKYEAEWASNMRVYEEGYENYSYGFRKAAEYAVGYLNEYIDALAEKGITRDSIKLWVTGYSRGAAIANNIAQIMTADGRIAAENIFGYSFATPETVLESAKGDYKNIFAICSELDVVPRLPLLEWDYTHFGTSLYLPCLSKNGEAYYDLVKGMQTEFDGIMAEIGATDVHNTPMDNQEKVIDLLASFLTTPIETPKQFKNEGWQDLFVGMMVENYTEGGNIADAIIDSLVPDVRIAQALKNFLLGASKRTAEQNIKELTSVMTQISLRKTLLASKRDRELLGMIYELLSDVVTCFKAERISKGRSESTKYYQLLIRAVVDIINEDIYSPVLMQHWPEAYLAWMFSSEDGSELFSDGHHELKPIKKPLLIGDVNGDGDVTKADATLLNKYILAPKKTTINLDAADIDGNGKINLIDVTKLTALLLICR